MKKENNLGFNPKFINISNRSVRYIKEGEGPPLILLHGLGRSVYQWRKHIPVFAEKYTVYTFDVPGFGHSEPLKKHELSIPFVTMFIEEFRQKLQIESPIILGGSFGGLAAIDYAIEFPNNLSKLILMDTVGVGRELGFPYRLLALPLIGEGWRYVDYRGIEDHNNWVWKTTSLPKLGAVIEGLITPPRSGILENTSKENRITPLKLFRYGVGLFGQKHVIRRDSVLHNISVPTLILWGAEDAMIPVRHAHKANRLIPNSSLYVFENSGHWPPRDVPEDFNKVVLEFCNS